MQVRRGTSRVRAFDVCDQQASAGHRDALPEAGRDMLVMYPADAQKRNLTGSAALLEIDGTGWLLLARNTDHRVVQVPHPCPVCYGGGKRSVLRSPRPDIVKMNVLSRFYP